MVRHSRGLMTLIVTLCMLLAAPLLYAVERVSEPAFATSLDTINLNVTSISLVSFMDVSPIVNTSRREENNLLVGSITCSWVTVDIKRNDDARLAEEIWDYAHRYGRYSRVMELLPIWRGTLLS